MKSVDIENIRYFTARLFAGTDFDDFLVPEAQFSTACTFSIDGHLNDAFLGEEDAKLPENSEGIAFWKRLKPVCYEIIKGKKVPTRFSIILMAPSFMVSQFIEKSGIAVNPGDINALFLNIYYRQGKLNCTTGSSMKTFSMDRTVELSWDEYMAGFLKQYI